MTKITRLFAGKQPKPTHAEFSLTQDGSTVDIIATIDDRNILVGFFRIEDGKIAFEAMKVDKDLFVTDDSGWLVANR